MAEREVPLGRLEDFPDGGLQATSADGTSVIVARDGQEICVAVNRCPHMGLPLTKGPGGTTFADGVVQCAWHNSRFAVCSGENLDWVSGVAGKRTPAWSHKLIGLGRKPRGLKTLPARVVDGRVLVTIDS